MPGKLNIHVQKNKTGPLFYTMPQNKFKIIPIKILAGFFIELHKLTLKSYKDKLPKNVQEKEQ